MWARWEGESEDWRCLSGWLHTVTANIDQRRKAVYETELIWWEGGRGVEENEREDSEIEADRSGRSRGLARESKRNLALCLSVGLCMCEDHPLPLAPNPASGVREISPFSILPRTRARTSSRDASVDLVFSPSCPSSVVGGNSATYFLSFG